jgi:putative peptidoglycan lipid II flippase
MLPRTISFALDQISLTLTVYIATYLAAGSLSIYNFSQHLNNLPVNLFGLTIGQAALPSLAREANINKDNFRRLFTDSLHQVLYLALPASIMLLVLRIPAVRLAFGAKTFPWEATLLTGKIVGILAISIFSQAVTELFIRSFYALQDTKTPLILKGVTAIINVLLSFWFVFNLGLGIVGLALAVTITNFIQALLLFTFLGNKTGSLFTKPVLMPILKIFGATILAGIFLWGPMRFLDRYLLDTTKTINLIVLTVIVLVLSGSIYLLFSAILKVEQLQSFLSVLKRFGQWKKILSESPEVLDEQR